MIRSVLVHGRDKMGKKLGMEPREITHVIENAWWPNAEGNAISSIAWRMWKRGELEKNGSLYMLPQKETAGSPTTEQPVKPG